MTAPLLVASLLGLSPLSAPTRIVPLAGLFPSGAGRTVLPGLASVVVYRSDGSVKGVARQLPRLLRAHWEPTGTAGRFRLERSKEEAADVRGIETSVLRTTILEGLRPTEALRAAPFDASLAATLEGGLGRPVKAGSVNYNSRGAGEALLAHLVADLAPRLPGELRFHRSDVYALPTSPRERPLPASASGLAGAYPAVEGALADRVAAAGGRVSRYDAERLRPTGDGGRIARTVVLFRSDETDILAVLSLFGEDGAFRGSGAMGLPLIQAKGRPWTFDGAGDALARPLPGQGGLLRPEPLDAAVGPALDALAKRIGLPVYVALPDEAATAFEDARPATLGAAVSLLEGQGIEFTVEDGAVLGRPVDPLRAQRRNLSRPALARYLAAMGSASGDGATGEGATRAGATGRGDRPDAPREWARLRAASPAMTPLGERIGRALRFDLGDVSDTTWDLLGRLSDDEWGALRGGRAIAIGGDPARRALADELGADLGKAPGSARPDVALLGSWSFPNGIPVDATISLGSGPEWMLKWPMDSHWRDLETEASYPPLVDAQGEAGLARTIAGYEYARYSAAGIGEGKVEFGRRARLTLLFRPGPGLQRAETFPGVEVVSSGPPTRFQDAPPEARRALLAVVVAANRWREPGGRRPPPP